MRLLTPSIALLVVLATTASPVVAQTPATVSPADLAFEAEPIGGIGDIEVEHTGAGGVGRPDRSCPMGVGDPGGVRQDEERRDQQAEQAASHATNRRGMPSPAPGDTSVSQG